MVLECPSNLDPVDQNPYPGDITYDQNPHPGDITYDENPYPYLTIKFPWLTLIGAQFQFHSYGIFCSTCF